MRTFLRPTFRLLAASLFLTFATSAVAVPAVAKTAAAASDGYTQTRYPIVLVHGLFGFDQLFGTIDYWYGTAAALSSSGATVYTAQVDAVNSEVARGTQLIQQLDNLRAVYGYSKFNLIGHSQGGLTVRYVASVRPDLVASVTSIGTPHTGTPVADGIITIAPPGSPQRALVANVVNAIGTLISVGSGAPADTSNAIAALDQLSSAGAAQFNALHPEGLPTSSCGAGAATVNGIRYYSFGGNTPVTNVFDPSDTLLGITSAFFKGATNDGLVGQCSSHLGTVIGDSYAWNHLDEVNQLFGLRGVFSPDPNEVWRAQANRLKGQGL